MKTTMDIPDSLFRELKSFAAARGLPLKAVLETALRDLLADCQSQGKPFKLRKHSVGGQGLQEGLSESDWEAIRGQAYESRGG